jgi:pyruvate-ferredoxin/flavodoxin oxidoreductase
VIFSGRRRTSTRAQNAEKGAPRYPGTLSAIDGSTAVVAMETAASEGAGAYPITPSTQMGEGWAAAVAEGARNVNGRKLLFFEPEGEHAAAAVTTGMSMVGLRAANFSSGQGIAYMHESLYAAVGKRLTYVLNIAARAMTKHALNVHAGHDDYHAVDDTGFFQLFAKDVQEAADLNLIAHRIAELSLNPGICAQDGFLTSHVIESMRLPERELVREFLGDPSDLIDSPTPSQRIVFGAQRRRIPEMFDLDYPAMLGVVQNQDSYAQGVAAQRPFYFEHVVELADRAFAEYAALTGRAYARASGYGIGDAEWVIAGQGSVVANAEAVADFLREQRGMRVGVLNLTMWRPFPSDVVARLLAGKRGVVVLERTDQPLAADAPMLRELRVAMAQAVENGRAPAQPLPYPAIPALRAEQVPDFFSGCFGLGSRDLQPGDIVAAVENMLPTRARRRQFYLGVDFLRPGTRLPKLQLWQQQITDAYPQIRERALESAGAFNLLPKGSVAVRIHSVGGWGAITMGKNLSATVFDLFRLQVKANPKYGSEKKGQPTTFYAVFAHEPVRLNCELKHVDVVLSPDPNVFRHSNPLAGLADGGVFVLQSDRDPESVWRSLPAWARREITNRKIRFLALDGFAIAGAEASDAELRFRMQGAAFMGAFFAVSPLMEREGLGKDSLFAGIRQQLEKKFARYGKQVVEDNLRVIERGFDEVRKVERLAEGVNGEAGDGEAPAPPELPDLLNAHTRDGFGNAGRFWEQVCFLQKAGSDGLADPYAAMSAIPAVTGVVRDMTDVRLEVPKFVPENCTGCSQCWTQCPDSAIPGLVVEIDQLIEVGIAQAATRPTNGESTTRIRQVARHLATESRKVLKATPSLSFADALSAAYRNVVAKLTWDAEKLAGLEEEFRRVHAKVAAFQVARTAPFFDGPEARQAGTGGLLAITINPEACKGCNLCVDVCPDDALVTVKQDAAVISQLREQWAYWQKLPDTPDRFINVPNIEEAIGTLPSLLLKKDVYRSMVGGDGACMGCGEKTSVHLVVSAIHAMMHPRVEKHLKDLDGLIATLDAGARTLLAGDVDLDTVAANGKADVPMSDPKRSRLALLNATRRSLEDLRWRYQEGPGGRGRARMGMANSTGCSSVWGATYPYNPYPFPWTNHLFQDSPSLAIGLFEGHMRKMADGFVNVRRARLLSTGEYEAAKHEAELGDLTWKTFTDEEFALCPPIVAMGGDGAMLDIGFQNLSRLLASGKPIRVIVLDTQVYSNTGGQACTSGFTGQVSDMAAFGKAQHGKLEERKELALIALAHRGAFVHQTSQASASHLLSGVLKGLQKRRPVVINIYTPCPVEHGLADDWSVHAARLALESRAFPYLTYDPDAGATLAECLTLDGNPALDAAWPTYTLEFRSDAGITEKLELPLTIADWAATEGRFRKHFRKLPPEEWTDDCVPFADVVALPVSEREGKTPFIFVAEREGATLGRLAVSAEIVTLADERQRFWSLLKEMAGLAVANREAEFETKLAQLAADYEAKLAALRAEYPAVIARRMASALLKQGGKTTIEELLNTTPAVVPGTAPAVPVALPARSSAAPVSPVEAGDRIVTPAPAAAGAAVAEPDELTMEAFIESARCTTCNECTNLNSRLFGYNAEKQAYIKDAKAGTFAQLVTAAERCPVGIIHPGSPLNPKEKDLAKWVERARKFQ